MSDTQGIDAPNCAHKQLKKRMVGEQVWYACECGQKFRIEAWDGKVSVLAPPDPRKDLAALEELVEECGLSLASGEIRCNFKHVETFESAEQITGAAGGDAWCKEMTERQLTRIMFEVVIVLAIGLLGFIGLSFYNMRVIEQQRQLIHDMNQNPACNHPATGGNHG